MSRLLKSALTLSAIAVVAFILGTLVSRPRNRHDTIEAATDIVTKHKQEEDMAREEKIYGSSKQIDAAQAIRQKWSDTISQLIQSASRGVKPLSLSDPENIRYPRHDSKHLSILLLGDIRAVEAVPVLLDNLEYHNPRELAGSYQDVNGLYPAAEALSKIGMPAVGPTIKKLGDYAPNSKGSEICCWILKKILGVRLARLRLQIAIEETRDEAVKKNLSAALPYFKTDQEKAAEERTRHKKTTD
jgi:hypothetical protein